MPETNMPETRRKTTRRRTRTTPRPRPGIHVQQTEDPEKMVFLFATGLDDGASNAKGQVVVGVTAAVELINDRLGPLDDDDPDDDSDIGIFRIWPSGKVECASIVTARIVSRIEPPTVGH